MLIALSGEELLIGIFSEAKEARCFAVIADESVDKSIKSQLIIVIRYLKSDTSTE